MDEDTAMTVPPPLPAKTQARGTGQGTRQTVSIRAISPTSSPSLTTGAGATVFVGVSSPAADSTATCRRRIPEVQSTNGFARPTSVHTSQQLQLHQEQQQQQQQQPQHQPQPQQQQQQAAHVVKIKINTDGDKNSRVISTVRLNLDGNIGRGLENGITCERAKKRNGAGVLSATNLVNETRCGSGVGEACVRISVGGDASERQESNYINNNNSSNLNNNHNNHNNNNNNNHNASNNNGYKHIERGSNGSAVRNNGHSRSDNDNEIEKDMVQRGTADTLNTSPLNNRSSGCFYYSSFQSPLAGMVMSSGQCSPSDTLDSGTCSDLDGTPPPLPKKKNASTVILAGTQHNRTGSLTSSGAEVDSDDNESNISCDSLNGRELAAERILASDGDNVNGSSNEAEDVVSSYGSRSNDLGKLKDEGEAANGVASKFELIRLTNGDRRKDDDDDNDDDNDDDDDDDDDDEDKTREAQRRVKAENDAEVASGSRSISRSVSPSPSGSSSSMSKASSTPRVRSPELPSEPNGRLSSPMVKECTYEERKQEQERIEQECAAADFYANYNRSSGNKYVYDDDRFYKFHVNELRGDSEDSSPESKEIGLGDKETDECFAGYKILEREAIRSAKGTVRGVKNRVRAGIATFLQKPSSKAYKAKEEGKVVVYTTTSGIVRQTFYNCMKVKQILRTHMVKYDERDLFRSAELQTELRDRIGCTAIQVPQLFIDGQYIGDADTVERLNESGELRRILKPYKTEDACTVCLFCGGYQLLLCPVCNGSKRSVHRNDFTVEFVALKCMNCDEVGLVRCPHC